MARVVLWPWAIMMWLFPPPCWPTESGRDFCEGTPVQMVAALIGLGLTFIFYLLISIGVARLQQQRATARLPRRGDARSES